MQARILASLVFMWLFQIYMFGQTPGIIIKPANSPGKAVLDPDGDGYVSKKTPPVTGIQLGFSSNDISESEIPYAPIVKPDPQGDPLVGPNCSYNEIVGTDAAGNNAVMSYYDGTNMLFRFRLAGYAPNSKSYSILIDTDQKFGFTGANADPNAVPGNPGFEVEIVLETNFGVEVCKVDGTTTPVVTTSFSTNPYSVNCQKAVALTTACSDPDYFYDFYIPFSQVTSIAGLGITANTPLRMVAVTSMNPMPAIGNNAVSDVGGVTTGSNLDAIYSDLVDSSTPTSTNNINSSGILDRSACPGINAVGTSNITITGSSTETSGTVNVYVYQSDGTTLIGSGSTSVSASWSINVSALSPAVTLAAGQIIKATVTATGKGTSYNNCNPVTVTDCSSQTSVPTSTEVVKIPGGKGYTVTISRPIGTKVYLYTSSYSLRSVTDLKNSVTNPFTTTTNPQTITLECQTGNCFSTDVYYFRFLEPGKCISPYYVSCDYATGGTSASPTISTSTITTSTTSISGNGTAASAQIYIYADGNQIASTTTAATSPYAWTASVSSLSLCQVITARQIISGQCLSDASTGVTVTRQAVKPVINFTGCSPTTPVTSLSGYSSEANGTTITLYTPNSSGTSLGSTTVSGGLWTKTGLSLASGTVVAKVTSGTCLTPSADSDPITISTQTNVASYTIGITTPTEGQTSVSGTISGGTYPLTLKVYVDEALVGSGITVNSAGNWTVLGLNSFDLSAGGKVQVKLTSGTGCESSLSSTYAIVQCSLPLDKTLSASSTVYCANSYGTITVQNSESGIIYTPIHEDGTTFGYGALGTGANLNLTTGLLTGSSPITIKVKAEKFPLGSCSRTLTGSVVFTINPLPAAPAASANQTYCGSGVTTLANLSVTPPAGCTVIWYNSASGGSSISSATTLVSGTTYYAESQNSTTGCSSSSRTAITVVSGTPAAPTANASQSFCSGATISNLVASLAGPGTIKWHTAPSGGTLKNAGDALVTGTNYYAETSQNTCVSSSRTLVGVTLYSSTAITGQSTGAQTQCIGGTFSSISVTASGAGLTYQWYSNTSASNSGGSPIGGATSSSYVPAATSAGDLYYYCIVNGSCGSPVTSDVSGVFTVNPLTVGGTVSGPATVCADVNSTNITLSAYTGSVVKWQSSATSDFSSSVTDIANTTATLTATNLSSTKYYRALVQSGVCTSQYSATSTITVNPLPSTPVIGTITQPTCGLPTGSVELSNLPASGNWTITPSTGSSVSGTGATHIFTGLAPSAIYTFTVTNDNNCTSAASTNAVINDVPTPPSTPVVTVTTQPTCGTPSGTIVINTQTGVQYSVGGAYQGSETFLNLVPGTYTISVRNTADHSCVTSAGSTVTINAIPSPPSIPSASSVVQPTCGSPSGTITFNTLSGVQYSVGGAYQDDAMFTGLTPGNYTLYARSKSDNTCISSSVSDETINPVPPAPSVPTAVASQSFCNGISPKVSDIVISGTNITWYDALNGGNIVNPATALVNNKTYYATQSSSGCESSPRTGVTVSVLACTGPDIEDNTVNINENLANGTQVYNINDAGTGNDKDIDVNSLTYSIKGGNELGAFTIDPLTGIITVADASILNYETITSFSLIVEATNGTITDQAVITINLNNLNDNAPVAVTDNYNVNEGATLTVPVPGVLNNDYDADGNSITAIKVTNPSHGTLTFNANGSFSYTHDGSETTSDAFTYKANDGTYDSNTVTVSISINPVNDKPVVSDISASVNEDNVLSFAAVNFTSAYTDADGNALTKIIIKSLPANGTLKLSGVNVGLNDEILTANISNLTFTPSANWNGNTSFSWNGFDGTVYAQSDANVQITVNAVNDAPTVTNINKSVNEDNTLTFAAADFTGDFSDIEGNSLTKIKITSLPVNGTLKLSGVNVNVNDEIAVADIDNLTYTPDADWNGSNSFGWNGFDGSAYASSPASVDITVNAVNDAPVISNINKSVNEDNTLTFAAFDFTNAFSDIDGNSLTKMKITSLPANGTLSLSGINVSINDEIPVASLGNLAFKPTTDWNGNTTFSWNGFDGTIYAASDKAVNITVNGINDAPTLSNINLSTNEDNVLSFTVNNFTGAFADIDGNSLEKIKISSLPTNGKLLLSGVEVEINDEILTASLANLTFAPDANWNGSTSFKWNGYDGFTFAGSDADVNITVNGVNDPPVISDIYKSVLSSATLTFSATDFTDAYTDIENNALQSIKITSLPLSGTLKLSGIAVTTNQIINSANLADLTYEPSGVGSASFSWSATDGTFYSAFDAVVVITITTTPNTPPVVSDFAKTINEDEPLTFVLADFTSAYTDVSALVKVKITSLPANATLKLSGFNVAVNDEIAAADLIYFTLTPNHNWNGGTSFGWNGFDGTDYATSAASVNITVNAVNDAPVVSDVSKNVNEDNTIAFSITDFTSEYTDAEATSLVKIKITSLPPNGTLKLSGVNVVAGQEITFANIDNLTFVPANNWNGNTSFTWSASDGSAYAASDANVNITINAVNDPPSVSDVAVSVNEDNVLTFAQSDFSGSFTDIDGNALSKIKITSLPAHGTLKLSGVTVSINDEIAVASIGNLTFTPNANWNGNTSFGWNGFDGTTYASSGAQVNILVNAVNDAPTVSDVSRTVSEDNTLTFNAIDFPGAYSDIDGDPLDKIKIISLPANGTLKLSGINVSVNDEITAANLGNLTFMPNSNWNGNTSLEWNGFDGNLYAASAAYVNITVNAANDAPVVSTVPKSGNEDNTITFALANFTGAFSDIDGNPLQKIKIESLPANGTLKLSGINVVVNDEILAANLANLEFIPDADWNGNTSFDWNGFDGSSYASSSANVNITINAVNDAPLVSDIYKSALTNISINFAASDFTDAYSDIENNALTKIRIESLPLNGTLKLSGVAIALNDEISAANLANITFEPASGWNGSTSFTWNAFDGNSYASSTADIHITISAVPNVPPVVSDFSKSVNEDQTLSFTSADFSGAYSDGNSDPIVSVKITSLPAHATLKLLGTNVLVNDEIPIGSIHNLELIPDNDWNGNTSFKWNALDGIAYAASDATVNITVNAQNDAPVLSSITKNGSEDNTLIFTVADFTNAFADIDGNSLTKVKITSLPANGTLKLSGVNVTLNQEIDAADLVNLTFLPDNNWNGSTSFSWSGFDGITYASLDASVNINVSASNDAPAISDISKSTNEDNILSFAKADFTGAYTDTDGDILTKIKITSLPTHGTLKLSGISLNIGDEILIDNVVNLTFTPDDDWNGTTSITWNGFDGTVYSASDASIDLTVNAVNDAPLVSDIYKSALTNTTVTFTGADFINAFSDIENNSLIKIRIETLPTDGTLKLSGNPVSANDEIIFADLGDLTFVPNNGWNGLTSFIWNGFDGNIYSSAGANVEITISAVPNTVPVVSNIAVSTDEDNTFVFNLSDFTNAFTDGDNDALARIKITSLPANGILQLSGVDVTINQEIAASDIGNLTFVPNTDWNGNTSFSWNGFDGIVYAASDANVNITVNAVNDLPTLTNIGKTTNEDNKSDFAASDFTGAFSDPEGNSLSKIKITSLPANGTLKLSGVPVTLDQEISLAYLSNLSFVPDANWNGTTSFSWNGSDGTSYAASGSVVTLTVNPVNDVPELSPVAKNVHTNTTATFTAADFTNSFTDPDNSLVKIKITSLPSNGVLKLAGVNVNVGDEINVADLGTLTFEPTNDWNGSTSFTWNGFDGISYAVNDANVNITVASTFNTPPVINDFAKQNSEDTSISFTATDFTSAFTDANGNNLVTIKITSLPEHGKLQLNGTDVSLNQEISSISLENLVFVPDANWNGSTSFGWNGSDDEDYAATEAKVNITVNAVNDAPVIGTSPLVKTMNEDGGPYSFDINSNITEPEGDNVSVSITGEPKHGTVSIDNSGNITYTPSENFNGNDTITWQVCDNATSALCSTGIIVITVSPVNDQPVLTNSLISQSIPGNSGAKTMEVLSNVVNVDGDIFTVSIFDSPANGTATVNSAGEIIYTPNTGFSGTDTIVYKICDNGTPSLCTTGTIIMNVSPVVVPNHAPVISNINLTTVQGQKVLFELNSFKSKLTDVDNDTLVSVRIVSLPAYGLLMLNDIAVTTGQEISWADLSKIQFVPEAAYSGETSFTWEASDGKDYSLTADVIITVTPQEIFIPEGFSPNGDGINDYFIIKGADQYVVTLRIFNRWGNLVYETKKYQNDWEGTSNTGLLLGSKLPDGTYFYTINFNNGEKEKIGYITVNR
jgi:gliding motility-associated-like protein